MKSNKAQNNKTRLEKLRPRIIKMRERGLMIDEVAEKLSILPDDVYEQFFWLPEYIKHENS